MGFFSRMKNGWKLAKVSLTTINENRSLLVFPVLSVLSMFLILSSVLGGGYFLVGENIETAFQDETANQGVGYAILFIYYLINFFIVVFFNSALIHCAIKIFNNEETSVGDGINFALSRIGKIFVWAVVSATVGTILRVLQNNGKIGEFVAGLIGLAWSILTFFVVPIIVYQDKGVFDSIKESGDLMRQKWGESLGGNFSFGIINLLAIFLAIGIGFMFMLINPILGIVVMSLSILTVATVLSAAKTVFVAAIYNRTNDLPSGKFDGETLDSAFIQRN